MEAKFKAIFECFKKETYIKKKDYFLEIWDSSNSYLACMKLITSRGPLPAYHVRVHCL